MNIKEKNIREVCSKNINQFIKYVKILTCDGFTQFHPYKFQTKLLRKFVKTLEPKKKKRNHIIVAPRQCGKTTIAAIYILWFAMFHPDKSVALTANTYMQAVEILNKVKEIYNNLPEFLTVKLTKNNKDRLYFENGSYIIASAMSYSAVCGRAFDLFIFDEMAFAENKTLEDFMKAIFPTQSARAHSQTILMSTPNGDNAFYEVYCHAKRGVSSYNATRVRYDEIPGRDEAWKEKMIRDYGIKFFEQEYNASFILSTPIEETNTITLNINTSPLSKEEAKGLMKKLKQLFSKKLTIEEIEEANYNITFE